MEQVLDNDQFLFGNSVEMTRMEENSKINTSNLFFISSNTFDVIIDDPLKIENLLNVVRVKKYLQATIQLFLAVKIMS